MPERFGETARRARVERGVSLRRVAEVLGWTPAYVSDIERLQRAAPAPAQARKWAEIIGADPDEFEIDAMLDRKVIELTVDRESDFGRAMAMLARSAADLSADEEAAIINTVHGVLGGRE